ncbi:MAG: DUF4276 family protein [Vicinamibacteria bacterium]
MHIELLLEEPSAEAFLVRFLPRVLPAEAVVKPIVFQGKLDLLAKLESRLKGYKSWLPADYRIVVLVDEDRQDCRKLKTRLENAAAAAGLTTKSKRAGGSFVVLNRIAVEELEAWFLGDPVALHAAYPKVSATLGKKAKFRDPDAVGGGTWEALEQVLKNAGYYKGGLPKIEVAKTVAPHMDSARNSSASFHCFLDGLASL